MSHVSALVLVNAMIFQEVLAEQNPKVQPLGKVLAGSDPIRGFCRHWRFIVEEINYFPIFHVAERILENLSAGKDSHAAIERLVATACEIVQHRAAPRHDLMGRIYHRHLAEAKYLGTYYTGIPGATLLLKLALDPRRWKVDGSTLKEVQEFRVADWACGTGTLLMAATDAITDNHISACADQSKPIDLAGLHGCLAEETIWDYDVLLSAIHLTASTLSLRSPQVTFGRMNLFSLPLGGPEQQLGSIEFLRSTELQLSLDLFGGAQVVQQVTGKGYRQIKSPAVRLPSLDLWAVNPPFVRSVGGSLLFGSLPEAARKLMQKRLQKVVKEAGAQANITAGLGSVFVATADPYVKPGGRLALVLPKAALSGVAWQETRDLLSRNYQLEYVVGSQDPHRCNFSESTSLSEVLLVAKKVADHQKPERAAVTGVSLWQSPATSFQALAVAQAILDGKPPDLSTGQGALAVRVGDQKVGEAIRLPWIEMQHRASWLWPVALAQSDLVRVALHLSKGSLRPNLSDSGFESCPESAQPGESTGARLAPCKKSSRPC